jgi:hypothetical protein
MRLLEVEELFEQMTNLMAGCPEELRLREHGHSVSRSVATAFCIKFQSIWLIHRSALDWAEQSYEDIRLLFEHPNSRTMVADSFLVQQANIYTTMVREGAHGAYWSIHTPLECHSWTSAHDTPAHASVSRRPSNSASKGDSPSARGSWLLLDFIKCCSDCNSRGTSVGRRGR